MALKRTNFTTYFVLANFNGNNTFGYTTLYGTNIILSFLMILELNILIYFGLMIIFF